MNVADFNGEINISTESEFAAALGKRYGNQANDFYLTYDGKDYPALQILIRDDLSYLYYYPYDGHAGFRSEGAKSKEYGSNTTFYLGSPTKEFEVLSDAVVPASEAIRAALEFFTSDKLPNAVRWFEL